MYFTEYTRTPRESAATGFSPAERMCRPVLVRQNHQYDAGISASARIVSPERFAVRPFASPVMSEITIQCRPSTHPNTSDVLWRPKNGPPDRNGNVKWKTVLVTWGDWVALPPVDGGYATTERNRAIPPARMLMATPETTWSTPNVTVATACRSPPAAPPPAPRSTPQYGPNFQPAQAPNHVPRIIIPSSPMFTTPTRSA